MRPRNGSPSRGRICPFRRALPRSVADQISFSYPRLYSAPRPLSSQRIPCLWPSACLPPGFSPPPSSRFLTFAAQAAVPAGVTQGATVEGITEYTLDNGLRVLLFPDATKPTTTVNVTYLVGSRQENYGETGMAHLLEHLLFKGTPSIPNIFQELGSPRHADERLDVLRPHQLFRDLHRLRREPRLGARRWKPTGWSTRSSRERTSTPR